MQAPTTPTADVQTFLPKAHERLDNAPTTERSTRFQFMDDPIHERMKNHKYYGKVIMLRSVYGKHTNDVKIEPSHRRGEDEGWLGIPGLGGTKALTAEEKARSNYPLARPGVTREKFHDGMLIDLGTEKGLYLWEWAQYAPQIVEDREATDYIEDKTHEGADTEFYILVPEEEEENVAKKHYDRLEAQNYVQELSPVAWYQLARLLGANMDNAKPVTVYNYLFGITVSTPKRILAAKNDKLGKVRLLFLQLKDQGIIKQSNGVFSYMSTALGTSEEQVLYWMQQAENQQVLTFMEKDIKINVGGGSAYATAYASYQQEDELVRKHASEPSSVDLLAGLPDLPTTGTGQLADSTEQNEQQEPGTSATEVPPAPTPEAGNANNKKETPKTS